MNRKDFIIVIFQSSNFNHFLFDLMHTVCYFLLAWILSDLVIINVFNAILTVWKLYQLVLTMFVMIWPWWVHAIATEVISENIYTYTGYVSHVQFNSSLDNKANTSKQTTMPFLTLISLSRGLFLWFSFSVILQLVTIFHNLQATKSSMHSKLALPPSVGGGVHLNYNSSTSPMYSNKAFFN